MKKFLLLAMGIMSLLSVAAMADDYDINESTGDQVQMDNTYESDYNFGGNSFGVGLGIGRYKSLYKGVGDKNYPVPLLDIQYGDFYVKGTDIGYGVLENDNFTMSVFLNPLGGFKEKGSDLGSGYNNIDDREYQAMFGVRMDINTPLDGMKTGIAVSAGEHGAKGRVGLYKAYEVMPKFVIVPSVHLMYYSSDFTDYYFGVDSSETYINRPGNYKLRSSYTPDAAYSYGASLVGEYRFTDKIALTAFLGAEKYSSEITDSPIVENDVIYSVGIGAKYYF